MRRFLALVAAFITLTGMAGQGPCVEVSSKLESQFICYLKGFKDGLFQFEMLNGDSRT